MLNLSRPLYRITRVDYVPTGNRSCWLEWRNTLKTVPTSSLLCGYFGFGYSSWNMILKEKINPTPLTEEEDKKINFLKEKALSHGTAFEPAAKELFKKYLEHLIKVECHHYKEIESGEVSNHYEIAYNNEKAGLVSTPDYIYFFKNDESGVAIAEFKCPFFCMIQRKEKSVLQVVKDFTLAHPSGRENAFIQAASYCLVEKAHRFCTVFYFTDTVDEEYIIIYNYESIPELYSIIFDSILKTEAALKELEEATRKGEPKNFRSPTVDKRAISKLMNTTLQSVIIYDGKDYFLKSELLGV